jgi:predicted 3-demethylubiquinone-9 3-methyltransferase (glyoxalase superfamily)
MQKITPFLWFDNNVDEAIRLYSSIFKDFKIDSISRYGESGPGPAGTVMTATFHINGQEIIALNGGPVFHFTEAISFFVTCDTQAEVDDLWEKLSDGGEKGQCGWLKDKFGLSWQIVPAILGELLGDKNAAKSANVTKAMLRMTKLDIDLLKKAYEQG